MQSSVPFTRSYSLPTQRGADGLSSQRPMALRLRGLCKQFGDTVLVNNAELDLPAGRVFGLVGMSGSGKTTVLTMATGLLPADEGQVHVFGIDACEDRKEVLPLIGVVPDSPSIPEHATGHESLIFTGMFGGLNREMVVARAEQVLAAVGLTDVATTPVSGYSPGLRKRLCLAGALLHDPELLILDDPFDDIDAESVAVMSSLIRQFAADGGAVLLATRSALEVEELCDQVASLHEGRLTTSRVVRRWSAELAVGVA